MFVGVRNYVMLSNKCNFHIFQSWLNYVPSVLENLILRLISKTLGASLVAVVGRLLSMALSEREKKILRTVYYRPGGHGGIDAVRSAVSRRGLLLSKNQVKEWLENQPTYTLHKPARKKFKTRKVRVSGPNIQWQADLMDMQNIAKENDGYRYVLTIIDCFSRVGRAVPLKDKTGKSITEAFKNFELPIKLQVDKGTEFYNKTFQSHLNEKNVTMFSTDSAYKAQMVERWNRTLKEKLWKYFTAKNTSKWIDVLDKIVEEYNNTPHRSLPKKLSPNQVKDRVKLVRLHLFKDMWLSPRKKPTFKVGDQVRISKTKRTFEKGYLPNYTEEIFTISKVLYTQPPTYKVKDYNGEELDGILYKEELSRVIKEDDVYIVEEILETKGRGNAKQYFVKWQGYPATMNSWVIAKDFVPTD